MGVKRRRDETAEETRQRLLIAGRELFYSKGFYETTTIEIAERAGLTRGAFYHHFDDKTGLFRAVVDEDDERFWRAIGEIAEASTSDPGFRITAAADAFLDACAQPRALRVVQLDPRAILGAEVYKSRERPAVGLFARLFQEAIAVGRTQRGEPYALAMMVLALLREASLLMADADDVEATRIELGSVVRAMLGGVIT